MNKFEKIDRATKLIVIYSFALPLGVYTVVLTHMFTTLFVFGVFEAHPPLDRLTLDNYAAWTMSQLGVYFVLLFIPKAFIYFKGGSKHRYKFLVYILLPVLIWLFMPTLALMSLGWILVAVGAYIEAITVVRRLHRISGK